MSRGYPIDRRGFTLLELLVVVAILALLISILLPSLSRARETANRTLCGTNLASMYKAMITYAHTNRDQFPRYGTDGTDQTVKGFQPIERATVFPEATSVRDNVTAAIFILVREVRTNTIHFVCPSAPGSFPDPRTLVGPADYTDSPAVLSQIWDFGLPKSLSYSPVNMYSRDIGNGWRATTRPDWILMSDDNNAEIDDALTPGGIHTSIKSSNAPISAIQSEENSGNHSEGEGQNVLFGDGHVAFHRDPFVGPSSNNIMALDTDSSNVEVAAPPSLVNNAIHPENAGIDVMLVPMTGNDGTNLSQ